MSQSLNSVPGKPFSAESVQEMWRLVLDTLRDPVFLHDRDYRITRANWAYASRTGLPFAEFIGQPYWQIYPKLTVPLCNCREVMNDSGCPEHDEVLEYEGCSFLSRSIPVYGTHGDYQYSLHILEDMTPIRRSADMVNRSEEQFRLVSAAMAEVFWMADISLEHIYYVSPGYEHLWGHSRAELYGNPHLFIEAIHPDDRERVVADLDAQVSGRAFDHVCRLLTPLGKVRWIWNRGFPIGDGRSTYRRYLGVALDITEQKETEKALLDREHAYWEIFNKMGEAMLIHDPYTAQIYDVNETFCQLYGYTRDEALHVSVSQLSADDSAATQDKARQLVETALRAGYLRFEWPARRKDGSAFVAEVTLNSATLLEQPRVLATVRDITDRKQAEDALHQLNQTLEQRVQEETARRIDHEHLLVQQSRLAAMGEMVNNIAHQWRQPLSALGLILQNISFDYEDKTLTQDSLNEYVARAMLDVHHMSSTIDDFRYFFRPNREKQIFPIAEAIEDAIRLIRDSFQHHNIRIVHDECGHTCRAIGYPNEFSQVILNLLNNAKDAIVAKGIAGQVGIDGVSGPDNFTVVIRDNGGGIPEDILPKVFDPYFTTKDKGTGIGLYMSKMILEHMNGDIAIRNLGDGTEVSVTLPLAPPNDKG